MHSHDDFAHKMGFIFRANFSNPLLNAHIETGIFVAYPYKYYMIWNLDIIAIVYNQQLAYASCNMKYSNGHNLF